MKAYIGKFIKKDGSERVMTFCRICDIPEKFLSEKLSGGKARVLPENMELVYDLEADNFRTFNHATIIGELKEIQIDNLFGISSFDHIKDMIG